VLALAAIVVAGGCAQFTVRADPNPDADFSRYGTFGWLPLAAAAPIDQDTGNRGLTDHIYSTVEQEMARKGYKPAANAAADLLMTFRLLRDDGYDDNVLPYQTAWQRGTYRAALHESSTTYTRGTLMIDVVERDNNQLVWRGSASARLMSLPSYERMVERAEDAVRQIMASLPGRAR